MFDDKVLVLLSGGQDSATCLAFAKENYKQVWTIAFNYNQRHYRELLASNLLSIMMDSEKHFVVNATAINQVATSALTQTEGDISASHEVNPELPSSFVPGRNLIFLSLAAAKAYGLGIKTLMTGVCQTDFSGYPDCRQEFITSAMKTITLALDSPITIEAPLMYVTKAETVKLMAEIGKLELYKYTHTCYEGQWPPCGKCPACELREKGFKQAGFIDPLTMGTEDPLHEIYGHDNNGNTKEE